MNRTLLKRMIITSAIAVLGVSTSFAALVMERDEGLDTAPSVDMYRYQVPTELQGNIKQCRCCQSNSIYGERT